MKKKTSCFGLLFAIGGIAYGALEIIWRKYTHWSMVLTGGLCFTALYKIFQRLNTCSLWLKCCIGSTVITYFEFLSGFVFNHCLKLGVWDYSKHRFNFCGQICPLYSFLWALLTIPVTMICKLLQKKFRL